MKPILLCLDGSIYTPPACEYAAWWSQCIGAHVEILYVSDLRQMEIPVFADLSGSLGVAPYQGVTSQLQSLEEKKAAMIEKIGSKALVESGLERTSIAFQHATGFLVDTIEKIQGNYAGIVIGKRGENADFARGHLGSMMERIVRSSKIPVFVTARQFRPIREVLLAYDASPATEMALDYLLTMKLERFGLTLISVAEDQESSKYADALRVAEERAIGSGIRVNCQLLGGEPEDAIASFVEEKNMDLMLMGAYGHSRLRNFFIGSTTGEMIRRCKIPVICFR